MDDDASSWRHCHVRLVALWESEAWLDPGTIAFVQLAMACTLVSVALTDA
jgi:hypothetical protein